MEDIFTLVVYGVIAAIFLFLWWSIGRVRENNHLKSLAGREAQFRDFRVTNLKAPVGMVVNPALPPTLVLGEAVIASDGFKTWVWKIRNIFGGESASFRTLYERAQREALLRLLASARQQGYNAVCNLRYESADIGGNACTTSKGKVMPMASCTTSATAYICQ